MRTLRLKCSIKTGEEASADQVESPNEKSPGMRHHRAGPSRLADRDLWDSHLLGIHSGLGEVSHQDPCSPRQGSDYVHSGPRMVGSQ